MLRRLIKASAIVLGMAPICLWVAGCSVTPVKMGAAAITGNERITIATLNTEVINLSQSVKQYPGLISMTPAQQTQQTLTWLVRFQINDQLAQQQGITVSTAQAQAALAVAYAAAKSQFEAQGMSNVTLNFVLADAGIPPDLSAELGRYLAIETQYVKNVNGGTLPTSASAQAAAGTKLDGAQCVAAKSLNILINPQFGQMNYASQAVVSAPSPVSGTPGPTPSPSTSGLAPAC